MKYKICHAGIRGGESTGYRFTEIPDNAIIVDYHIEVSEPFEVGRKFFGLIPEKAITKKPGFRYLVPMDDE